MPLTATGMRVVMRQLAEIDASPIDGIRIHPSDDLSELRFDLDGPEGTPFAEGRFHVALVFDEQYPEVPPKGYFRTKVFHPNVSDRGDICVNTLKRDWSPTLGLRHVLMVIRCLLVEPNPDSALNEDAGRLLLEDYADYERKAKMLTNVHARRPPGVPRITHPDPTATSASTGGTGAGSENQRQISGTVGPTAGSTSPAVSKPGEGGPLRCLEGNQAAPTAAAGGVPGAKKEDSHAADSAQEKAKKKAAEKKKNALKRI